MVIVAYWLMHLNVRRRHVQICKTGQISISNEADKPNLRCVSVIAEENK